jgi:hypothetical protein
MTLQERKAELEKMGWRDIKAIADRISIEKPEGETWEDTIPLILTHEFPNLAELGEAEAADAAQQEEIAEVFSVSVEEGQGAIVALGPTPTPQDTPPVPVKGKSHVYSTGFYNAARIPACGECGEKRRTGSAGELICPIESKSCPVLRGS